MGTDKLMEKRKYLLVENLNHATREETLRSRCSRWGEIANAVLLKDASSRFVGIGWVGYKSSFAFGGVLSMRDTLLIDGKKVTLRAAPSTAALGEGFRNALISGSNSPLVILKPLRATPAPAHLPTDTPSVPTGANSSRATTSSTATLQFNSPEMMTINSLSGTSNNYGGEPDCLDLLSLVSQTCFGTSG